MSNPFRRQLTTPDSASDGTIFAVPAASTAPLDSASPLFASIAPKTKRVKIQSPPRSPQTELSSPTNPYFFAETVQGYRSATPPFRVDHDEEQSDSDGLDSDPFEREPSQSSEDETVTSSIVTLPKRSGPLESGAAANPFSKALRSMEELPKNETDPAEPGVERDPQNKAASRGTMDVDAFKNMLMSGKASPSTATTGPPARLHFGLQADSSSSTDTSSVSRQSLFESLQEPHGDTPRTSYEMSISEEDDRSTLIGEGKKSENSKPPLPKHRHGKAMPQAPPTASQSAQGPEVEAFDDFTPSFGPTTARSPTLSKFSRASSDLNKPLPARPQDTAKDRTAVVSHQQPTEQAARLPASPGSTPPVPSPRKTPPAVPLTRRHSQMQRPNPLAPRSRSSTIASVASQGEEKSSSYPPSISESAGMKMAPPPPPARRSGASSSSTPTPHSSTPLNDGTASNLRRTPSARSTSLPTQNRSRSSSQLSHSSTSAVAAGITSPPPLPPPRRTSSRSSQDAPARLRGAATTPRTSADYSRRRSGESERTKSGAFLRDGAITEIEEGDKPDPPVREPMVYEPVPQPRDAPSDLARVAQPGAQPARMASSVAAKDDIENAEANPPEPVRSSSQDILADMEAFQREIDALREQCDNGRGRWG